ncbi:MAG: hypothetical protein AB8B87_00805 [Granulosicoccus sp.]
MSNSPDILILTDLDDSLFSTLRKIPASQQPGKTLAASAAAGKNSYMTRKQQAMVNWMDLSRCVPVTARSTEAYSRVTLPFAGPAAILANGAVMLNRNGTVNEEWASIVNSILSSQQDAIHGVVDTLKSIAARHAMNIRSWAVIEPSCDAVYAVAKSNTSTHGEDLLIIADELKSHLNTDDFQMKDAWQFHRNANNLSVTPKGISKAIATEYLLEKIRSEKAVLTVGVGDSASDLGFMRLCDVWLTPTRSQIDQLL